MASEYFSHDCDAQYDDKCVRLLQVLGWKGYGVYWGLVERLSKRDDCSLEYNPAGLAWQLHVQEKFLVRVITEFNLFVVSEDGTRFWSESARRRRAMRYKKPQDPNQPKRKPGRPRKYPRPEDAQPEPLAIQETAPTTERKSCEDKKIEPGTKTVEPEPKTPQSEVAEQTLSIYQPEQNNAAKTQESLSDTAMPTVSPTNEPQTDSNEYVSESETKVPTTEIVETWNQIFKGTPQVYRGLYLDSISYQRARESLDVGYTLDDLTQAFKIARNDSFSWLLKDVLKPDNIQRLLIKGDKQNVNANSITGTNSGYYTEDQSEDPKDWRSDAFWDRFVSNGSGAAVAVAK